MFLGGAKRVSLAERFVAAGQSLGFKVELYTYELDRFVPLGAIATVVEGKRWSDSGIEDHLIEIVEREQINILIPSVDPAVSLLSRLRARLNCFLPVPPLDACDTFFDKALAQKFFVSHGLPVPPLATSRYPQIAKPRKGSASQGLSIFHDEADRLRFFTDHDAQTYIVQEYVSPRIELTVDAYVSLRDGQVKSCVPRIRLDTAGGEATRTVTVRDEAAIALSHQAIALAGLSGPVTLQFLKGSNNDKLAFMEINPRFGGGVIASIAAGADSPRMLLEDYLNHDITPPEWRENYLMTRCFREFFYENYC